MISKHRTEIVSLIALLILAAGLGILFSGWIIDRSFITYRYARNMAGGLGFAYNPGENVLSEAISPLYALMLALAASFTADLPLVGNLIGAVSMGLGTLAVYGLALNSGKWSAAITAGLYAAFPLLWLTVGLEPALWMALAAGALWMHMRGWDVGAAVLLALATLLRPEAGALALVILADSLATKNENQFLAPVLYAGLVILGALGIGSLLDTGSPFPGLPGAGTAPIPPDITAGTVTAGLGTLTTGLFALSPLWVGVLLLAIAGIIRLVADRRSDDRWAILLACWAALHTIVFMMLGAAVYAWHFAPLITAILALAGLGIQWLAERFKEKNVRRAVSGLGLLLAVGAAAESLLRLSLTPMAGQPWEALTPAPIQTADSEAAAWLVSNTPPEAVVGTSRIGLLGYLADRHMVDIYGSLQPDIAQAAARGDMTWWVAEYLPEVLVLHASEVAALTAPEDQPDPWFSTLYAEAVRFDESSSDPLLILMRTSVPLPFTEHMVGMTTYSGGLVLNSFALDFTLDPLEEDRVGRVRLEWLLNEDIDAPRYVSIRIQSRDGSIAALSGNTVHFENWPQRQLITTYHSLELLPFHPPGAYMLDIGTGPDPFNLTWQTITTAKVPFPETDFVGALSGTRADFGDMALLGYRLSSSPDEGIEVVLRWQAIQVPQTNYRVFIHVRDALGQIATQLTTEPHDGTYPTSFWSAGEQVTDSYRFGTAELAPGEYEVYVGLLDADNRRMLTANGQDSVFVGRLTTGQ